MKGSKNSSVVSQGPGSDRPNRLKRRPRKKMSTSRFWSSAANSVRMRRDKSSLPQTSQFGYLPIVSWVLRARYSAQHQIFLVGVCGVCSDGTGDLCRAKLLDPFALVTVTGPVWKRDGQVETVSLMTRYPRRGEPQPFPGSAFPKELDESLSNVSASR